jgi:hypothetical protein
MAILVLVCKVISMNVFKGLIRFLFGQGKKTRETLRSPSNESNKPIVTFVNIGTEFAEIAKRNNSKAEIEVLMQRDKVHRAY